MKKFIIFTFIFLLTNFLIIINSLDVSAHSTLLTIEYDDCIPESITDGEDEVWYYLCETNYSMGPNFDYYHIGQNTSTIKYYFEDAARNGSGYTWTTDIDEELADKIKTAYVNSMMKWNDVYYYSYDNNGNRVTHKLINIEEGTEDDHNLSIYPLENYFKAPIASTGNMHSGENIPTNITNITHRHISDFYMNVNIKYFYRDDNNKLVTDEQLKVVKERTGMHEVGHILGLDDVDTCCTKGVTFEDHHDEILMGYGVLEDRQDNVTYKDIAGISIIREFHTDTNHTWMKRINDDSTIDLICAQCNGVLYDIDMDLNGITYQGQNVNIYKDCIHHSGTTSNMLLVATDGERNFFKCQNCRHIETVEISEEFSLSNYSSTINKIITLNSNETKYYKINSNYNKYYEFIIKGISTFTIKLFDDNFNEIPITNLNDSNLADYIINQLQVGTYYLELKNISSISNSISLKIVSRTTAYIGVGDNDVLLNTHNYNEGIYQNNYYYYINNRGVGFYRFTLTGIKTDGTEITYPVGTIVIKDHKNEDVIDKYSFIGYFNQAITDYNENTFIAYLNAIGYFYVYIDIETEGLKSLTLNIEPVESEIIDLFTKSTTTDSNFNIFNYEILKGDYIKEFDLKQSGKFTISYNYNGLQINDMLFVLSKLNYNEQTNKYSLETIISQLMDVENNAYTNTLNLTDGIYYIGYFNKKDTGTFNISFNRLVTEYNPNTLVTDPERNTDCGSQINIYESDIDIYERSYRSTEIVKGFTRIIYFDVNLVNQYSRGDYYWYSSNNSVATVSQHGTVFGETCGNVKIMAVNKDNSSIVFVKEFTIIPDTKTYTTSKIIKINDTYKTSNNTDYKLGLTIQNSPYPMVQYYTWQIYYRDDTITSVQLDEYGNVEIKGTGEVIFWGKNYIYNNNYEIRIHVKVTE